MKCNKQNINCLFFCTHRRYVSVHRLLSCRIHCIPLYSLLTRCYLHRRTVHEMFYTAFKSEFAIGDWHSARWKSTPRRQRSQTLCSNLEQNCRQTQAKPLLPCQFRIYLTTSHATQNECIYISIFALGTVTSNAYFSVNKSLHHYKSNNKMCLLLFILAHSLSSKPIDSKCNSFLGRRAIVHRFAGSRVRSALEQFCFEKFFECKIDRDAWKHIAVVGTHAIGHGQRRNAWVHFHLQFVNVVWLMWCVRKRMTSEYAHRYRLCLRQWHSHRQINVDAFILPLSLSLCLPLRLNLMILWLLRSKVFALCGAKSVQR